MDGGSFQAAHGEVFLAFSKVHPFLAELRALSHEPEYCRHVEAVVLATANAEATLARRRAAAMAAAAARAAAPPATA
ncbi:MAG: hypothetical protein ABIT38_05750 [Gemmatimonadaceae bacterium]